MRIVPSLLVLVCAPLSASIAEAKSPAEYWADTRDYIVAPLHWDAADWLVTGSVLGGIAGAYTLDSSVHDHFAPGGTPKASSSSARDAAPLGAMLLGTFAAGTLSRDSELTGTGWDMSEAVVLGTLSSQAFKLLAGRERPYETNSPGRFGHGGSSFPSGHTTAAFAAAQVLADEIPHDQWGWRVLAYGLGAATAYARMDSNAHWLSDTVAGAALGIATGRFVSNRDPDRNSGLSVSMAPLHRGAMLKFAVDIR